MDRYLPARLSKPSDDVILAPKSINPKATDASNKVEEFKLQGKQYIRCGALTKNPKATRQRTSPIWRWGEDIQLKDGDCKVQYYYCYLCERAKAKQELLIVSSGRSSALDHLCEDHYMDKVSGELNQSAPRASNQPTVEAYPAAWSLEFNRNFESFKELLIRWIVCCHIAFFQFENAYFRQLLYFLYPGLEKLLPKASKTIRNWVIKRFEQRKEDLRKELHNAVSAISISFDLWTSPNSYAVLGVFAHFINKDGRRRHVVLGLRELVGEHSGENMAAVLLELFKNYRISGNIGYFMADNADSNDKAINAILRALYPGLSAKQRKARRLRCFGHITNLCAQAFIIGKDTEKVCKELATAYREMDFKKVDELWKKRGAVGLMHNLVRYICNSPQRRSFFRRIKIGGSLTEFDGLEVSIFRSS